MGFSPLEPKLGVALAGIALAILVPTWTDLSQAKEGFERGVAMGGALGALGTFFGMIDASGGGPSLWPHGAWGLLGIGFGAVVIMGAMASDKPWWQVGLGAIALAQLVAMAGPILAGLRSRNGTHRQ